MKSEAEELGTSDFAPDFSSLERRGGMKGHRFLSPSLPLQKNGLNLINIAANHGEQGEGGALAGRA